MTPAEYRAHIARLGMSQIEAGRWLGVSPRTAQRWATKGPPKVVAKLLQLMELNSVTTEDMA